MFDKLQPALFEVPQKIGVLDNSFIKAAQKVSAETLSGNNALKYSTTGNEFVDEFGKLGTYLKPRSFADISSDCSILYALDPLMFIKFTLYMRIIDRKTQYKGEKIQQNGAGLKHESIMRMIWLYTQNPDMFWDNLHLFLAVGSLKDIIQMLRYDVMYNGWNNKVLPWQELGYAILAYLEDPSTSELMKKYLPRIQCKSHCTTLASQANTIIGKFLANIFCSGQYNTYRKLKSGGTAHQWQQIISQKRMQELEFDKIHGRALNLLVKSKFLKNQGLSDKYGEWIKAQKTVKYTGYVHELLCELDSHRIDTNFISTVEKQFQELVEKAKLDEKYMTNLIVVRDTSASMTSTASGTKYSSYNVAKAMALYFSEFLHGSFSNAWIEFNNDAKLHKWMGSRVHEKWFNDRSSHVGSTNFLSVIKLFARLKDQGISESEFPKGILCISDNEFNPDQLGRTNVEAARQILRNAGFSPEYCDNFQIILWNIPNNYYGNRQPTFETFGDVKNVFYMSGYSPSCIKFIMSGKVETAADLFEAAMNQPILQYCKINAVELV